jgi:2-dehydro-3-deoxygluconokinase
MTRIVAIGEAMVEMAPQDKDSTYQMGFAGDTLNTAWYLRHLLPPRDSVDFVTSVGMDAASDQMVSFIAAARIGTDHIARHPDRTVGLYMIQLTEGERSFSYWRGQSAARTLAHDAQVLAQALAGADVAYFSGITIAILPPQDRLRLFDALRDFRSAGGEVIFDPNLRPRLWADKQEMTTAVMQAAVVSDVALPSHEDEADWFGDANPTETAQRYQSAGAKTGVVKNGAGPMLAWEDGVLSTHHPVKVAQIVDTTAAGDSFNAGFLASRQSGDGLSQSIQAGANLAARVIGARGALVWDQTN